jgi:NAD(P)-dependent dehydrogenase (short-subunit alcohol dehydrogenase family)
VIGASRGFGAALSLALAARGYDVHGTHSAPAGPLSGPVTLHRLDARDAAGMTRLAADIGPIDGVVLNAALSPLSMGLTAEAASDLSAYVATSLELGAVPLGALLAAVTDFVVVCSSSALSAPPRDWPHYVAAKAALEGLASWVAETYPELRTVILRPPAMRTEMTNTPTGRIAPVATETIATWVADRLADGELPAGLTTWEPGTVTAQER